MDGAEWRVEYPPLWSLQSSIQSATPLAHARACRPGAHRSNTPSTPAITARHTRWSSRNSTEKAGFGWSAWPYPLWRCFDTFSPRFRCVHNPYSSSARTARSFAFPMRRTPPSSLLSRGIGSHRTPQRRSRSSRGSGGDSPSCYSSRFASRTVRRGCGCRTLPRAWLCILRPSSGSLTDCSSLRGNDLKRSTSDLWIYNALPTFL